MAEMFSGPSRVLECGNKAWKVHVGERVDIISRAALHASKRGRLRTASVTSVASSLVVAKPRGACVTEPEFYK